MIITDDVEARQRAAKLIAAGGVLAFRTDTFYGLGANPFDERALLSLHELKHREGKPVLVVISNRAQAARFIENKSFIFDALAARHWPGPLTIVARSRKELSTILTAGTKTIGVRLPDDERVREFVEACGGALTATSANLPGEPPARNAFEVARAFPNNLDLIVDAGETRSEKPSTVVDVNCYPPRLVREGAVSLDELIETFDSIGLQLE